MCYLARVSDQQIATLGRKCVGDLSGTQGEAIIVSMMKKSGIVLSAVMLTLLVPQISMAREHRMTPEGQEIPFKILKDWPRTDFSKYSAPLFDFMPAGPRKDEIPSINSPKLRDIAAADQASLEPIISISINGEARAYPVAILLWHEIVNDDVGGVPVAVTFSPLTNSSRVFRREVSGEVTTFGTSGLLRHTGQVFYDRLTQSWWQQILGEAVFGTSTGQKLEALPARIEGLGQFAARHPGGTVLVPNIGGYRPYGRTPFPRYDSAAVAYRYKGTYKGAVPPMTRVIVVGDEAWSLDLIRTRGTLEVSSGAGDLRMRYEAGQNSPFDKAVIAKSRDIGSVVVQRRVDGTWSDVAYDVPFAFAWKAFHPDHSIHH